MIFVTIVLLLVAVFGVFLCWLDVSEKGNEMLDKIAEWLWD